MTRATSQDIAILRYYMGELREKGEGHPQHVVADLSRRGLLTIHVVRDDDGAEYPAIITNSMGRAEVARHDRERAPVSDPILARKNGMGER